MNTIVNIFEISEIIFKEEGMIILDLFLNYAVDYIIEIISTFFYALYILHRAKKRNPVLIKKIKENHPSVMRTIIYPKKDGTWETISTPTDETIEKITNG